jgi:2'-5' RNA ligase
MRSAVIVRTRLPATLEGIRRRAVRDAADGVPAHLTLLYPFVDPARLDRPVRQAIEAVAARHQPFDYRLTRPGRWPETVYLAVEPEGPFVRLQADLSAAFPDYPIYGSLARYAYLPHVTIVEGSAATDPAGAVGRSLAHDAWRSLPVTSRATVVEVIATTSDGRWRTVWRIRLG